MSALPTLYRGENLLVTKSLLQADGTTPLLASALTLAMVTVSQGGVELESFIYEVDEELRDGAVENQLVLELSGAFTRTLTSGIPLDLQWYFEIGDADFAVDSDTQRDQVPDASIVNVV